MYAETGFLYPYFQGFSQEVQQLEDFCRFQKTNVPGDNLFQTSVCEYDLGGEGDLFKAPEPIIEEPIIRLDPMSAAISMISCGEDIIPSQPIKVTDIDIRSEQLLSEVYYECKKDLLANSGIEESFPEDLDVKIPAVQMDDNPTAEKHWSTSDAPIPKSVSFDCLSSMDQFHGGAARPNFLDFQGMVFETAYGMRRAFSEGDIQTLGNGNTSFIHSQFERPVTIGNYTLEERRQRLSRYRKKKTKRNFGRKIKYACRKALADSQPRVRGRFAKTEDSEVPKS
ncbi:zinc finger protein CONSTANS-LIKE 9-like isoform X1 [Macadamia integrifolia]|uniref:zinc finger protein CONSTANS-LIKE 9-like isoform X1 n=1 Tax=Macadamia integrifolia TaxID=60698 RepID=UPI001C4F8BD6|nr:zinc finger protein CONSTANS-LIKE 9-like isoform X1 [Macadamia integrifolia]